ncbi:MAG: tail fiber protein [Proteobacteria bacterium]|nr:tail fiber protein [Pseudomonadota bacterium]
MAGSAFNLTTGIGSDGKSTRATKTQIGHGFSAGSVLRYVQNALGNTGDFQLATADSTVNAEVVGVVESVSANEFTIVYQGEIDTSNFGSDVGGPLTLSDVWFLDPGVSGGLTPYAPTSGGNVVKPIITLVSGANDDIGLVTNFVGTVIGGENTVSLASVHPVGEIIPWGGETYNIPSGWQLCDGGTVDTTTYPEYYTTVGTKFGYEVTLVVNTQGDTAHASTGQLMDEGATASQVLGIPSTQVDASVISYTETASGAGGSATVVLDPDVTTGFTAHRGETSGDNTGYPHGLVFDTSELTNGNTAYVVSSRTITASKTPDMRARVTMGAGDAHGTFDGYTAGQMGGAEDADILQISDGGSGVYAYVGTATNANLRQPYVATHYITRIASTAKAALIGDVTFNIEDDGLTDHDTGTKSDGDTLVWDSDASKYKNLKIFNSYPGTDGSAFEAGFVIDTTNTRIGVGTNSPGTEIHVAKSTNVRGKFQRTSGATAEIIGASSRGIIRTSGTGKYLDFETNNGTQIATCWSSADPNANGFKVYYKLDAAGGISCDGDIDANYNIKSAGQIYTTLPTIQTGTTFTPNFNNGNVSYWKKSSGSVTVATPSNEKAGAMYTLVLENSSSSDNRTINSFSGHYKFANGIKPNLIRASSTVVVSMVCMSGTNFLCTWAEDFS